MFGNGFVQMDPLPSTTSTAPGLVQYNPVGFDTSCSATREPELSLSRPMEPQVIIPYGTNTECLTLWNKYNTSKKENYTLY